MFLSSRVVPSTRAVGQVASRAASLSTGSGSSSPSSDSTAGEHRGVLVDRHGGDADAVSWLAT
jgi:hypothetical protein